MMVCIRESNITAHNFFQSNLLSPKQYGVIYKMKTMLMKLLIPKLIAENIQTEYDYYTRLLIYMRSHWALKLLLYYWNKSCKWIKCIIVVSTYNNTVLYNLHFLIVPQLQLILYRLHSDLSGLKIYRVW